MRECGKGDGREGFQSSAQSKLLPSLLFWWITENLLSQAQKSLIVTPEARSSVLERQGEAGEGQAGVCQDVLSWELDQAAVPALPPGAQQRHAAHPAHPAPPCPFLPGAQPSSREPGQGRGPGVFPVTELAGSRTLQ